MRFPGLNIYRIVQNSNIRAFGILSWFPVRAHCACTGVSLISCLPPNLSREFFLETDCGAFSSANSVPETCAMRMHEPVNIHTSRYALVQSDVRMPCSLGTRRVKTLQCNDRRVEIV
eukprot:COSAG02_NODE_973_length_15536_cov_5.108635_8_plen_117_part_00